MMIALLILGACLFVGSSSGILYEKECYGRALILPSEYKPPNFRGQLYITPSDGGPRRVLLENGEVKDPRIRIDYRGISLTDLSERDNGLIFRINVDGELLHVISLTILDCARQYTKYYGDTFHYVTSTMLHYLKFTPMQHNGPPRVLWNRTDPRTHRGRGSLRYNVWEMTDLTQADNGYYNFWTAYGLLSRIHLTVKEHSQTYEKEAKEELYIAFLSRGVPWTVTFFPKEQMAQETLMSDGRLTTGDNWSGNPFQGRIQLLDDGLEIQRLQIQDSGTFEFKDPYGNLAMTVQLEVNQEPGTGVGKYITVGVISGVISICCGCVKMCCCKKSSSKTDESTPQSPEELPVYNHDVDQPATPSYAGEPPPDYSTQLMNSSVFGEPATTSPEKSMCHPVNIHVNPLQPEPAAPAGPSDDPAPSFSSNNLSSDPEPTFELKGLTFPSAPPLNSDSADVYTSDKFNFL